MNAKGWALVALWALACAMLVSFAAYVLIGCAQMPTPAQQADVVAYQAEQLECVREYSTKKEIDACRDFVKARHGRLDAGVHDGN